MVRFTDFLRRLILLLPLAGRRGAARLWSLGSVLGAAAVTPVHARGVERATHDMVTHTRQILHTAATNQHDRVFLQVVPFARNVGGHFDAVGEANAGHLAERGVRLLRRGGVDASAYATLLRVWT